MGRSPTDVLSALWKCPRCKSDPHPLGSTEREEERGWSGHRQRRAGSSCQLNISEGLCSTVPPKVVPPARGLILKLPIGIL